MSRSYKKSPVVKQSGRTKQFYKKLTSKCVRQYLKNPDNGIANGNAYRGMFVNQWDVCDWWAHSFERNMQSYIQDDLRSISRFIKRCWVTQEPIAYYSMGGDEPTLIDEQPSEWLTTFRDKPKLTDEEEIAETTVWWQRQFLRK